MAFVRGYTHDVFISYAHADDRPFAGGERGWVTAFAEDLNTALSQRLSGDAEIWMDIRELRGNVPLTPSIMKALRETATFVVVVSPRYLASEWCRDERESFLRLVSERSAAGTRMFKVELDSVEEAPGAPARPTPPEFDELIGYKFWVKEWNKPVPRTLGWPLPNPLRDQDYYDRIKELSYELAEELERIDAAQGGDGPPAEQEPKTTVYLAEVTDDLEGKREKIKAYLKQSGIGVLPEKWRSHKDLDAYKRAVDADLTRCPLFVQLLSEVTGKRPFGQAHGYPRLQYERAALAGKPVLQWRSEAAELDEADKDQRALLEGCAVRAEGFEEFKKAVVKAATQQDEPPQPRQHAGKFVFISTDTADRTRAETAVCDSLKRRGINYAMPPSSGDPEVARKFLELSLTNCDAALVVYCETDIATVFSQTLQCRKVIAQRDEPLPLIAVFDAPPPSEREPLPFSFDNLIHLNCREDPAALDRFLDSL